MFREMFHFSIQEQNSFVRLDAYNKKTNEFTHVDFKFGTSVGKTYAEARKLALTELKAKISAWNPADMEALHYSSNSITHQASPKSAVNIEPITLKTSPNFIAANAESVIPVGQIK